ncbi:MAG TPA: ABC transporter permease [Abditibacteriaceae bacterium]|jgi:simple sugar transport system permease protein
MRALSRVRWLTPFIAIGLALMVSAAFIALAGGDVRAAFGALVYGAAGNKIRLAETLSKAIPLCLAGLGVALAFRAGFWNIGAEGQMLMGALAATALATRGGIFSNLFFVLLGGALAGAAWALIAGWLKFRRGAPEIIATIMLNYVAVQLVAFAVLGPLQERVRRQPQSDVFPVSAQLPSLISGTTFHAGAFLALACAVACWHLLFRTETGFLMRASGEGERAARLHGIAVEKQRVLAVGLSGALCGLGGACALAGATKQLAQGELGFGYTAIAVALLANSHPLGIVPTAIFFGALSAGGGSMERLAGVPAVTVAVVTGAVIFAVAVFSRRR